MSLLRTVLAAAAALLTAPAAAADAASGKPRVYVCARPTPAQHVRHVEHGRLHFVSARELLAGPAPGGKPRCITAAELERYRELAAARTRTVASR